MPQEGWKTWAGEATQEFLDLVNGEAVEMLGGGDAPFATHAQPSGSVAFLSLLTRDLTFRKKFHRATTQGLDFQFGEDSRKVEFWGITGSGSGHYGSFVRVLWWEAGKRSKAVEILAEGDDRVILFEPAKAMNFTDACKQVRDLKERWTMRSGEWGGANDKSLHAMDNLRIPALVLEGDAEFSERLSGALTFGGPQPFRVAYAKQKHLLKLDERGAQVKVVVDAGLEPFGEAPPAPQMLSRDLIFDRPFFVFLWRDGTDWPYFSAWIGDFAGMTEFAK
ncbi:hypothetical protein ACFQY0_17750 [Haloferula chungangensis]|uniref:Serpin domain-containing protein n=1 Tax=Haloferula chungangensis TaxID=1048331 RepID=A0ABW2LCH9_9BACT